MEEQDEIYSLEDVVKNLNKEIVFYSKVEQNKNLKSCSYQKGNITQEVWACVTCYKEKSEMAGICTSCSLNCHKDHELIHLYFKRNFQCDCGNSKFDIPCNMQIEKEYDNPTNAYNHNFIGKYCYCDSPEDDEDENDNINMLQCLICEDWYHSKCLNIYKPCDEKGDLICRNCTNNKISFMNFYPEGEFLKLINNCNVNNLLNKEKECKLDKNILPKNGLDIQSNFKKRKFSEAFIDNNNEINTQKKFKSSNDNENIGTSSSANPENFLSTSKKELPANSSECKLDFFKQNSVTKNELTFKNFDIFVDIHKFHSIICKCNCCYEYLKLNNIDFLISTDFVDDWTNRKLLEDALNEEAEEESPDNQNILQNADNLNLSNLGEFKKLSYEKQIELSMVTDSFKDKFLQYLKELPSEDKIITKEHVHKFLEQFRKEDPFLKKIYDES